LHVHERGGWPHIPSCSPSNVFLFLRTHRRLQHCRFASVCCTYQHCRSGWWQHRRRRLYFSRGPPGAALLGQVAAHSTSLPAATGVLDCACTLLVCLAWGWKLVCFLSRLVCCSCGNNSACGAVTVVEVWVLTLCSCLRAAVLCSSPCCGCAQMGAGHVTVSFLEAHPSPNLAQPVLTSCSCCACVGTWWWAQNQRHNACPASALLCAQMVLGFYPAW
jgi:hypothetical protein